MGIFNNLSGAGTVIIEDKNGSVCIVLGQSKHSHKYSDFGGSYDKKDFDVIDTAKRELEEESLNLVKVKRKYFVHYVDIPSGQHKYRAFIIKINDIHQKYFHHNKRILEKNKAPRCWREISNIAHLPFTGENIQNLVKHHKMASLDGKMLPISSRCRYILLFAVHLIIKQSKGRPIMTRKNLIRNITNNFTNDTFSFVK